MQQKVETLSHDRLLEVLDYDKETGFFFWKKRLSIRAVVGERAGSKASNGYITIRVDKQLYLAHRLAWFYVNGEWPEGEVDHINHCRFDNRFENLRLVDRTNNARNVGISKRNKSGVVGVCWLARVGMWNAEIRDKNRKVHLGMFEDFDEAVKARKAAETEYGYHKNHGQDLSVTKVDYSLNRLKGICWEKRYKKWSVAYYDPRKDGKHVYIGLFDDYFEACCALKSHQIGASWYEIIEARANNTKPDNINWVERDNRWVVKSDGQHISSHKDFFEACCALKSYEAKACSWSKVQERKKKRESGNKMVGLNLRNDKWIAVAKRKHIGSYTEIWDAICSIKSYQAQACSYNKVHSH